MSSSSALRKARVLTLYKHLLRQASLLPTAQAGTAARKNIREAFEYRKTSSLSDFDQLMNDGSETLKCLKTVNNMPHAKEIFEFHNHVGLS